MRVYEIAKENDISSKEVLALLEKGGFDASSHMSVLSLDAISYIEKHFDSDDSSDNEKSGSFKGDKVVASEKVKPKIEEKVPVSIEVKKPLHKSQRSFTNNHNSSRPGVITEIKIDRDMPLFEVADVMGKSSGDLILALMKKGMVCNRNHVLSKDIIISLAQEFGLSVTQEKSTDPVGNATKKPASGDIRWPIVVVMGHVDHGKTTLLDFVRKTSVAAKEAGGITQHLGAYEVTSSHGKLVFLDTPGHAAFSSMRKRGTSITDIAILVIAADDGVMPQTIEAIKVAQDAKVPIVVAINKIDKIDSESRIETIKRQLSEKGLVPEDWGGDTICVPISAKTGKGVDELLDMIVLQAEIMELRANPNFAARGFVLESNMEKGHGPISTVICIEGTIKQGDYFLCGNTRGKVRLMVDSLGKKVTQAGPSIPVKLVGFTELASAGDILEVVSYSDYLKKKSSRLSQNLSTGTISDTGQAYINLVVKADTYGSVEAVNGFIKALSKSLKGNIKKYKIVQSGVGPVTEGNILLARDTDSMIVAMNVPLERTAVVSSKENKIRVLEHKIIYRLTEELEKILEDTRIIPVVYKKVSEAEVIKVFNIKGTGTIAGSRIKSGTFVKDAFAVCIRDGKELAKAKITSLQRNNKPVKEVHIDMEFAFITKSFQDWQVGDTVHCLIEVPEGS